MALVNNKYKFIFCHLYKCGGTSVREVLMELESSQNIIGGHPLPRDVKHYYEHRGQKFVDRFAEMFKFTIVRNPFAFLLSTYNYAKSYSNHMWHKDVVNMPYKDFPTFYMSKVWEYEKKRVFGRNEIVTPYQFITDKKGEVILDFVGKLENIDKDMKFIFDKIGVPNVKIPKSNVNRDNNKPYREVYDSKTRAYVEKHFAKDLEYFEYEF